MAIKKGDFVALDFVGRLQETGQIFDLADEALAKKENIYNPRVTYGPKIICVGQRQVVTGLDDSLVGKEVNRTYTVALTPEESFGKKDARLLKIVPSSVFKKQNIKPFPGLQLNVDGRLGIVRTVSGGRNIVDFNHPLAGRQVMYEVTVKRIVIDTQEKLAHYLTTLLNKKVQCVVKEGKATIIISIPEQLHKPLKEQLKKIIPELKEIVFVQEQEEKKKATSQP